MRAGLRRHHRVDDRKWCARRRSDPETRRLLEGPVHPDAGPRRRARTRSAAGHPWRRGRDIAPELDGYWTTGFMMASPTPELSDAATLYRTGRTAGGSVTRSKSVGSSVVAPVASAMASGCQRSGHRAGQPLLRQSAGRASSNASLPKPGTGPSERTRERGHYTVETYTTTTTGARYRATMSQKGDPGYKATSVLLGESGLALALDRDRLSDLRGVLTPAAAMGDALLARFPAAGVSLETVPAELIGAAQNTCQPRSCGLVSCSACGNQQ